MQQSLSQRLARSAEASRIWQEQPTPVALVITDLDAGGAERALVSLTSRINRQRWRPAVFCLDKPGVLVDALLEANVPCECLNIRRRHPLQAVTRLARGLRRFKPQVVQSFMFHANLVTRFAAPWAGFPWVIGGLRVAEREKRWHLTLDRLTARLSTGSVCVSRGVLRFSRDIAGLDPERLTVIPNGIEIAPFVAAMPVPRAALGIPDNAHLALYVGRLDRQKGLPDLLEAAEQVISRRADWHLALAGDGPCRDWLVQHTVDTGILRGRVHWLGRRTDIPSLLKSADILVHASLWEGMPNSVLEAMAAGKAVVGTAVEGTEDLIVPGQTGWLVPPHDAVTLARVLLEAAESPERLTRYGRAGQLRAEHEFSLETTVAAYEQLWARILGYRFQNTNARPQ